MTTPSGKTPVFLTAVQVDLIGEALVEHISQLTHRLSSVPQKRTSLEELSLLKAYLELAKIIIGQNGVHNSGNGTSVSPVRVARGHTAGPSALQDPALKLRQP